MSSVSGFFKGMTAGFVVGAAAVLITDPLSTRDRKRIVRKTEGLFRRVGSVIDTAVDMIK